MVKLVPNSSKINKREKIILLRKLGKKIKTLRQEKGFTQKELIKRIGIDRSHLIRIEKGEIAASTFILWKIAKALDVPLSDLLSELG